MAHFVIGHPAPFFFVKHAALLFEARYDSLSGSGEIVEVHGVGISARRYNCGLVDKIGDVSPSEACGEPCFDIIRQPAEVRRHIGYVPQLL